VAAPAELAAAAASSQTFCVLAREGQSSSVIMLLQVHVLPCVAVVRAAAAALEAPAGQQRARVGVGVAFVFAHWCMRP
jgi:hypothetical protein